MKSVDEWKVLFRVKLRAALGAKGKPALTVLREVLAAFNNAEAPPMTITTSTAGPSAGSVGGLGAGEVEHLMLAADAVLAVVERKLSERREVAAEYKRLGRDEEAIALSTQADVLAAITAEVVN